MKHIFTNRHTIPATVFVASTTAMIPSSNLKNPMATMSPCPASKFMENPYCSYINIFLFTLYIILAAVGVAFTTWAIFAYLKTQYNYSIQAKIEDRERGDREGRGQTRGLARDLEAGLARSTARLESQPLLAGDSTNYGAIATTTLPRQRRRGVGVVAIGDAEEGTIARRRRRRESSLSRVVEAEERERESDEEGEDKSEGGEMGFETL